MSAGSPDEQLKVKIFDVDSLFLRYSPVTSGREYFKNVQLTVHS